MCAGKRDNKDRTILFNKDGTLANIFSSNEVSNDTAAYFSGIWTLIDSTIDSDKAKCIIRYISGDNPKILLVTLFLMYKGQESLI